MEWADEALSIDPPLPGWLGWEGNEMTVVVQERVGGERKRA